jgi:oxalate decarboxylase/phosphoglucose isomerase-like protein (cupin superfamily)
MNLPKESKLIRNELRNIDARGEILSIVDEKISNVSIITCAKSTIRSNHYHKKDFHFMYVLEGKIDYFYKSLENETIRYISVEVGDSIFTPCMEIHATFFPVTTKLIVSSGFPRDQKTYENDTVRVEFLNENNIEDMLIKYAK